jgi:hypothetical protein
MGKKMGKQGILYAHLSTPLTGNLKKLTWYTDYEKGTGPLSSLATLFSRNTFINS